MARSEEVANVVQSLYQAVEELESLFPGRKFTPDGHLVGSLGEALASELYDLELLPASSETHDARTTIGQLVQIKATQGSRVAIYSEPDYLLVLRLNRDGSASEIYNGPGKPAWNAAGKMQKNGQRQVSVSRLRVLAAEVSPELRLAARRGGGLNELAARLRKGAD